MSDTTSANEIFLNYLSTQLNIPFGDSLIFWFVGILIALVVFTFLQHFTDVSKPVALVAGFSVIVLMDLVTSYGTYIFELPFIGAYEVERLVMTLGLVDYIFGYQLFNPAKDIILSYATPEVITTLPIQFTALALSIGDSILQIIIFYLTIYYVISLIEYHRNQEYEWQIPVSIVGALFPVLLYAIFFSNPIHEYEVAIVEASNIMSFFNNATISEILYVIVLGFISFLIVFTIISTMAHFLLSAAINVRPGLKMQTWSTDYTSIAFLLTLLYTFLYIMHPDYKWYLILMVIIIWKVFRGFMEEVSTKAKLKTGQRSEMRSQAREIVDTMALEFDIPKSSTSLNREPKSEVGLNIEILIAVALIALVGLGILLFTGVL